MRNVILALVLTGTSSLAFGEIHCQATRGEEALRVSVIDTFLGKIAFINRIHPEIKYPVAEVAVSIQEKNKLLIFENEAEEFKMELIRETYERRLPAIYHAAFKYRSIQGTLDCTLN